MVMTADDIAEYYGPNGMDSDDWAAWSLACDRNCDHYPAIEVSEFLNRDVVHCPDCGKEVSGKQVRDSLPSEEEIAEQRFFSSLGM